MNARRDEWHGILDRGRTLCVVFGTHDAGPRLLDAAAEILNKSEAARLGRIRIPGKRTEFLLSRLVVKSVARDLLGGEPCEISLAPRDAGPSVLEGVREAATGAGLSHCKGAIAFALSLAGAVGVDIEPARRAPLSVARRFFPPREYNEILRSGDPASECTVRWTLKESYAKASGMPLMRALHEAEFKLEEGKYRLWETPDGDGWTFLSARVTGGYRLAAARSGGGMTDILECGGVSLLAGGLR